MLPTVYKPASERVFYRPRISAFLIYLFSMLDTIISACLNSSQASSEHRRPAARAAPLFSFKSGSPAGLKKPKPVTQPSTVSLGSRGPPSVQRGRAGKWSDDRNSWSSEQTEQGRQSTPVADSRPATSEAFTSAPASDAFGRQPDRDN